MSLDLDDRMAAVEKSIADLQAAVKGTDDDSSLDARVTKLEVEVFPPVAPATPAPADAPVPTDVPAPAADQTNNAPAGN